MHQLASEIIGQIKQNVPHSTVAAKYLWDQIPMEDKEMLYAEAEKNLDSPQGHELLRVIWVLVNKNYPWDAIRVLSLVSRIEKDPKRKEQHLKRIAAKLEEARRTISNTPQDASKMKRYASFYSDYHVMYAQYYESIGDYANAIKSYTIASDCYTKNGSSNYAIEVQKNIANLERRMQKDYHVLSIDQLKQERAEIEEQLIGLNKQIEQANQEITRLNVEQKNLEQKKQALEASVHGKIKEFEAAKKKANDQEQVLLRNMGLVKQAESSLHFLLALQKATVAPIWVEVVRYALENNRMDDFTRQAVERLTLDCPQEALPLLAEIAARTPQPFTVSVDESQPALSRWFTLIADARQLQSTDPIAAAHKLVEAWDTFFVMNGNHA